jgi:hypothetical protein
LLLAAWYVRTAMTPMPMPPQLAAALEQLDAVIQQVEKRKVDFFSEPWDVIEKSAIKLLGGPFDPGVPEHQVVALGLAAAFAQRLGNEFGAFWFPLRDSLEGASLGFPETIIMLSPFGAVADALGRAKLATLDDVMRDVRTALGKAKFAPTAQGPVRLTPADYQRLFDPGFVQMVAVDGAKLKSTWGLTPERLSRDVRDAMSRSNALPAEVKKQMEAQLLGSLQRLPPGQPLTASLAKAPRVAELMALLFAANQTTGCAGEEFWADVALPLLLVGDPTSFPPLDEEELAVAKQGIDPLFLLIDVVPYQFKAPDENGVLGLFGAEDVELPDPAFADSRSLRVLQVKAGGIQEALRAFDERTTREVVRRFGELVREKAGAVPSQGQAEAKQMLDAAMVLLKDLKEMVASGKTLWVRHLTEAEAASEPALAQVRQAATGPRIILAP